MNLSKQVSDLAWVTTPPVPLGGAQTFAPVTSGLAGEKFVPFLGVQLGRGLSADARLYALRQLALRAAIPQELLDSWTVEVSDDATVVTLGRDAKIRFRHAPATFWHDLVNASYQVVRAAWPYPPVSPCADLVPDLVVPFVDRAYAGPRYSPTKEICTDASSPRRVWRSSITSCIVLSWMNTVWLYSR